jgi:hypothetical protein
MLTVRATLNYQKLVQPVGEFLNVPEEETEIIKVNDHFTTVEIFD